MALRNEQKEIPQRLGVAKKCNGFEIPILMLKVYTVGMFRRAELMILTDHLAILLCQSNLQGHYYVLLFILKLFCANKPSVDT